MNTTLLTQLKGLVQRDTETRERLLREGRLYGRYDQEMQIVHIENAQALQGIIEAGGWPGKSRVGLEGSRMAWLIAQHAIATPVLQRGFLRALEAAANADDAPFRQVAFLSDRIRFNEGRPQVYGTVLDWNEKGELGCSLEFPDRVDEYRLAVGLPPFEEARQQHQREIAAEGGAPPNDIAAYRQAGEAWAKHVGWR